MNGVIFMMKQRYKQLMTATLTKQNASYKAFVGGNIIDRDTFPFKILLSSLNTRWFFSSTS